MASLLSSFFVSDTLFDIYNLLISIPHCFLRFWHVVSVFSECAAMGAAQGGMAQALAKLAIRLGVCFCWRIYIIVQIYWIPSIELVNFSPCILFYLRLLSRRAVLFVACGLKE